MAGGGPGALLAFEATIIHWRGPPPYLFAPVPDELVGEVKIASRTASYGWGVVPVTAVIGTTEFSTSLFPRNGGYLLPIKVAVQRAEDVSIGDRVQIAMQIVDK